MHPSRNSNSMNMSLTNNNNSSHTNTNMNHTNHIVELSQQTERQHDILNKYAVFHQQSSGRALDNHHKKGNHKKTMTPTAVLFTSNSNENDAI
jgi:hypothetical protein